MEWLHEDEVPGCVDGTGGCPPEDCGGPPGYAELQAVLADPGHEEHARLAGTSPGALGFPDYVADVRRRHKPTRNPMKLRDSRGW